ncbi:PQQ-dependent sugar dehydrogenase [Epibacterium sp. Ofav1-8]|uniref:PQQ-dependent sugar dehydrogenase n=1 Tax=Epibacterium sp. Ofav1-8 TaxID=2917735 RepID=UPI001EF4DAF5|nr:PQQ-dependent sugar dehydrogenase [Epibacterium sp. Ofav1-8]MCG7622699.1 PQQ-dependent sugar dehydrogenase [Epibacterium sp. Ofav1-8]
MIYRLALIFCLSLGSALATPPKAAAMDSNQGQLTVEKMVDGLDVPWGFTFLDDDALLVTERDGRLWYVKEGRKQTVSGVPTVAADGQGGLLDVVAARDFDQSRRIYLTYAKPQGRGAGTAVARATLSPDNRQLTDVAVIFEAKPGARGGRHFGARLVEARDGSLFVSLGERGDRPSAQDLGREQGSVIRILPDGRIPGDNPFVGVQNARPAIWSYGHRNPQGLAMDAQGRLWGVEHGAKGGDEVNLIEKGTNYGWPVISYGTHYSGRKIGEGTQTPGMAQPEWYWDPSIAPSGLMIYSGKLWPEWQGDLFVGSLKFDYISRLSGTPLKEVERLKSPQTGRVRDLREAPDGSIWFASEYDGALYRLRPQ